MVIAPANTGKESNNNTAVITTAHPNKANLCSLIPGLLIFNIVVMTLNLVKLLTNLLADYIFSVFKYYKYGV